MDPGRWQKIKPILDDVLVIEPDARSTFIRQACGNDDELISEVEALLDLDNLDSDPLERSAHDHLFPAHDRSLIGEQIGKYKIVSELGVGGMGAVYLAERADGAYTKKVALKLIKHGSNSRMILKKFVTERQILASLQHEKIAQLIDGGAADDGSPFIVMEYVEGTPITDYVTQNDLELNEKLELFLEVCSAVAFAHQNLIIHRDLKPSNIFVNDKGVPKLLDFGIAKPLEVDSAEGVTATHQFVFTPEYTSPEQVRGEKLTTAADIYSLGVILYELLIGRRPYRTDNRNITEIIRVVCESQPIAPSRAITKEDNDGPTPDGQPPTKNEKSKRSRRERASSLKGDLDSIVLKALRKEPDRRYSSVELFAQDIRRYLAGLPVAARADTWRYRTGKFIRRHRVSVAAAILIALSLCAGFVATIMQARIAAVERARAENRFNDVRHLANSFVFEINDKIDESPIKARALLVERSTEYLDSLASESNTDDSLESELAAAYEKIGDVQAEIFKPNLGDAGGALESQNKALQLRLSLYEKDPDQTGRGLDLVRSYQQVGNIETVTGDIRSAAEHYRKAVEISERLSLTHGEDPNIQTQLSSSYLMLGQSTLRSGSLSDSLAAYLRSFAINQQLLLREPGDLDLARHQSIAHTYIGYVRMLMGRPEEAVADYESSLAIDRDILQTDPQNLRFERAFNTSLLWMGIGYRESGRFAESIAKIRESIDSERAIYDADRQNYAEKNAMGDCWLEMASTLAREGKFDQSIPAFRTSITYYTEVSENDKENQSALAQLRMSQRMMADALAEQRKLDDAYKIYQSAFETFTDLVHRDPGNLEWQYELAMCRKGLGNISERKGNDRDNAVASYSEALVSLKRLISSSPENVKYINAMAQIESRLKILNPGG